MKVLVTGAGGYIGRHVVTKLLDLGHNVIASDLSFNEVDPRATRCEIPLFSGDEDIYRKVGSPDVCIHLAWRNGFVHNASSHMGDLSGHITFCNAMMAGGLPALSVMGTMHEVGYWEGAIDENTPCNPLSQYGIAKNAMRQSLLLSAKQTNCKFSWLRAYYIIGDDARGSSIFSKLTQAAMDGKKEFPFTTGKNKYDFISLHELANMIIAVSLDQEASGIINVCSGKPVSLGERVEQFIHDKQYDITLKYGVFPERAYDSPGIWGDAEKIKKIMKKYSENL